MDLITEELIDNIITNLKIISLLQPNEKLNIRKGHLNIDHGSNLQFIKRWIYGDNRYNVLKFIKIIFRDIQKIKNKKSLKKILNEFEKVEIGLKNLKITYSDDSVINVNIDIIINKMNNLKVFSYI